MNEDLLQYIWNFKKFKNLNFSTTDGQSLEVLDFGTWNINSGPDFLMAKIKVDNLVFIGNIEFHVRSSDWLLHQHSGNPDFENLILHVVYAEDVILEEFKNKKIPTLILKDYIDEALLWRYQEMQKQQSFVPCEQLFHPSAIPLQWEEELLLQKLEDKCEQYLPSLEKSKNDYEALLFQQLAYSFGLKVNAEILLQMAEAIDFRIVSKIQNEPNLLEALFYGMCGELDSPTDEVTQLWRRDFDFLKSKFQLPTLSFKLKYSKLRPPNFPNIRLSQLANLYFSHHHLFSIFIEKGNIIEIKKVLSSVTAHEYWDSHFVFGKKSSKSYPKKLSENFINLVLLNCVLPIQYFYRKDQEEETVSNIIEKYKEVAPEKNSILTQWENLGLVFQNGMHTQAFLYLYKSFCIQKKCLNCGIGFQLLKNV
ncbi:DUF2851 family protein [Elizabethkingia sp. JS20170427COW]|uniref:DUF2851 family protein n=1 Tax=Elizabethkingia sp. JS20170427COW TaxID=2583851 RepID=UPI001110D575|nr:DUF2851 family protein [Elizabethkingia sp. JS20170427COW]QCX52743.1 DUF2851 family protein [Elizabethkingia sp. JS20170427COW]